MDRKDVGILAMDIYFPPTCVQQVKFSSLTTLSCARLMRLPSPRPAGGASLMRW
jgi:hypothetical protein